MFETVVPYTPKARSRLCRLCSRRISSICRIRSRDAPSRVTAEKGKKTIKTFYKLLAVCERNISTHKHYHVLFLVREGEYTSPIFVKSFLPKKFKKKMKQIRCEIIVVEFFHRSLDLYVAMNLFISIKVLKVLLLNLLPGSDQSDFVLSLSNCTIQTPQIIECN